MLHRQRWHIVKYPNLESDKWWLRVDETLMLYQMELKSEVKISAWVLWSKHYIYCVSASNIVIYQCIYSNLQGGQGDLRWSSLMHDEGGHGQWAGQLADGPSGTCQVRWTFEAAGVEFKETEDRTCLRRREEYQGCLITFLIDNIKNIEAQNLNCEKPKFQSNQCQQEPPGIVAACSRKCHRDI